MHGADDTNLWPSASYRQGVERLKAAVGRPVYLAEILISETQASARITDRPFELLAVVDFPRPDPAKRLFPHLIIVDDGRGINLGHIARISLNTPFDPPEQDLLFEDRGYLAGYLFAESGFTKEWIAAHSKRSLGQWLGKPETALPTLPPRSGPRALGGPDDD